VCLLLYDFLLPFLLLLQRFDLVLFHSYLLIIAMGADLFRKDNTKIKGPWGEGVGNWLMDYVFFHHYWGYLIMSYVHYIFEVK
jgi:hypothetical protein